MHEAAPLLWLGGATALDLAPRLEASGYRTDPLPSAGDRGPSDLPPAAIILSPSCADRIAGLRRRWGTLPILLGCPLDNVEGRCRALESGADDLWLTSLGPSDLLTRLRLHLTLRRQPGVGQGTGPIQVGDLQVDLAQQTVRRGGHPLALTSREYQLLALLLNHRPHVVSRERILQEIWPEERTAASNVIEVYVRYLRRKLEAEGQTRLIHTVRGEGYCLREAGPTNG
jgi:two-component system response regulator MprA